MGGYRGQWGRRHVRERQNDQLANLDPLEFERVMANYYRRQGYEVEECGTGGTGRGFDGGIDLKLRRAGEYVVVQCKRHNAYQLTHNPVHELLGVAGTEGADRCILVNTGEFTRYAWEVAAKNPKLQLIDGSELRRMLPELACPVERTMAPAMEIVDRQSGGAPLRGWENYALSIPDAKPPPFRVTVRDSRRERESDGWSAIWVTGAFIVILLIVLRQCSSNTPMQVRTAPVPPVQPAAQSRQPPQQATTAQPARAPSAERPPAAPASRRYTAEELREQQRRADEAIKVIEATTPEM